MNQPIDRAELTHRIYAQAGWLLGNAQKRGDVDAQWRIRGLIADMKTFDRTSREKWEGTKLASP